LAHLAAQERCDEFDEVASLGASHRVPPRSADATTIDENLCQCLSFETPTSFELDDREKRSSLAPSGESIHGKRGCDDAESARRTRNETTLSCFRVSMQRAMMMARTPMNRVRCGYRCAGAGAGIRQSGSQRRAWVRLVCTTGPTPKAKISVPIPTVP